MLLEVHARATSRLADELEAECGLPLTWYDVLVQLQEAPGHRLRMQELARAVLLSKSGLTRLVDRMTEEDLVARESCPEDRRGQYVALTNQGLERLRTAAPIHLRGIEEHFAAYLSLDKATTIRDALAEVRAHLG